MAGYPHQVPPHQPVRPLKVTLEDSRSLGHQGSDPWDETPATFLATVLLMMVAGGRDTDHTVPRLLGSHFCGSLRALLIKYNFEMKDDPV